MPTLFFFNMMPKTIDQDIPLTKTRGTGQRIGLVHRLQTSLGIMIQQLANPETPLNITQSMTAPSGFHAAVKHKVEKDLPSTDLECVVIDDWRQLEARIGDWKRLAITSIESNVFYEPHFLMPALEHLSNSDVSILLIQAPIRVHQDDRRVLCGLFPIRKNRSLRGLPVSNLEMWQHPHCFLTTPLIRRDVATETINAFLDWQEAGRQRLFHFPLLSSGGEFDNLLIDALRERKTIRTVRDSHRRATLLRRQSTNEVLKVGMSRKRRHELKRNRKKLEAIGNIEVETLTDSSHVAEWIEQFLKLESKSWKGRQNTSIAQTRCQRNFFESMVNLSASQRRLTMLRMKLDDTTIAMKLNLLSGDGAFCFKIVYDENHGRFSPGVLLEIENMDWLHQPECSIRWMDSCAQAGHPMIESVWPDRRKIESIILPSKRWGATMCASLLPLLRAIKSAVKRSR